ncbi:flippase [Clostridium perfringens]
MEKKSIKKNFFYNIILTSTNIIFPLVTAPYLSYTLGAENIGKVNFATSLVNWFILISAFGIPRYGIREIAKNRDNKKELSNIFWNLILIQLMLSIASIIIYIVIIFNISKLKPDLNLYLMMILMMILNIFSIDWFYQGIEEYGYITKRNIVFKLISIALIFILIKDSSDYIFYATINIFGLCFNNILNYLHARKYINKKIYKLKILYYIKELRIYFVTTLIIALYTQLDQIFVGYNSAKDLAFYLRSKMVLGVGLSITNSLVTVLIPRTAYLMKNDYNSYKIMICKSIDYIYIIGLPSIVGMFMLSKEIMTLLGGKEFIPASYSLQIISFLIVINSIGSWQVNQILIPYGKEKLAFKMQCIGAVLSIVLDIVLVTRFSYIGAAIAWTLTELVLVIIEAFIICKIIKDIKIIYLTKSFFKYFLASLGMGIVIIFIKNTIDNNNLKIILSVIMGVVTYGIFILLLKDKIVLDMLNKIKLKKKFNNKIIK